MSRTMVVTGAASGVGKSVAELLTSRGMNVIGVDLHDADVIADLSTVDGRQHMVAAVTERSGGAVDAILAVAGVGGSPATVAVNHFGMVATLEGLRPLLAASSAPRAAAVCSLASIYPADDELVAAMDANDEPTAMARAAELAQDPESAGVIYYSSKRGFARWLRRAAATDHWAGAGIPLNAIAPAIIVTPMSAPVLATEESRQQVMSGVPMPLNGFAEAIVPAHLLAWLVSEENTHLCGQIIFLDGGSEVIARGDSVW